MIPTVEHSLDFQQAHACYQDAVGRWANLMSRQGEILRLNACDNAYLNGLSRDSVYFVQAGTLAYRHDDKTLFQWSEGDLLGIEHLAGAFSQAPGELLAVDDYALLVSFRLEDVEAALVQDAGIRRLWLQIIGLQQVLLSKLVGQLVEQENQPVPGFRRFPEGAEIIHQGDEAEYVYTIIDGTADVLVDGIKVGEIGEEEIFGALAVLTGGRRCATVIATRTCSVMMVHRDEFFLMVKTHPHLFMALVQDMAKTILKLNDRVVDLQGR